MRKRKDQWEPWEDEFILEVYPLREWSVETISEKLERTIRAVIQRAIFLEVKRPRLLLDYDAIARLSREGKELKTIASKLGYSRQAVRYALKVIAKEAA